MIGEPLNMKTFSTGKFGPKRVSSTVKHEKKHIKRISMSCLFTYMAYLFVINSISCSRTIIILLYQKRFMAYANSEGSREPANP